MSNHQHLAHRGQMSTLNYSSFHIPRAKFLILLAFLCLWSVCRSYAQISFSKKTLQDIKVTSTTSLEFDPDGKLYVAERTGLLKVFTIVKQNDEYVAQETQVIELIRQIPNHDDDGESCGTTSAVSYCFGRLITGLTVVGTPEHPVVYVSSSDIRSGAGGSGGDVDLDTNSGIITQLTWNGESWEAIDLIRGLPRSEENHAPNGLEVVSIQGKEHLLVAVGGLTNAGAPSNNLAFICEYALSAAVLAIDLDALAEMPVLTDEESGRMYIYDLPTLDDPTRPNANGIENPQAPGYDGIDINDPWGGNDGLNQAKLITNSPVKMFSPGYRNSYDLVVTEKGAVYVTDNGANGGWGGYPKFEATAQVDNSYRLGEPGSKFKKGQKSDAENNEEQVNNADHLNLVTTNIQNYTFNSVYGGHPCPTRANPNAGLYTRGIHTADPGDSNGDGFTDGFFRTKKYNPNGPGEASNPKKALPADWPPVDPSLFNVDNADYRQPAFGPDDNSENDPNLDGYNDIIVYTWGNNTNGIDEYTASNFGGAMKGNLIAGRNNGKLHRIVLNPDGTVNEEASEQDKFTTNGNPLGITCQGDGDIFPGTIWIANFNANEIVILEPDEILSCENPEASPEADFDQDGFTNADELANETDPCSGASQPNDYDGDQLSDLLDQDDDNDGIDDLEDALQIGTAFDLPVYNEFRSDEAPYNGFLQLGLVGLMSNGIDPWYGAIGSRDVLGGTTGLLTLVVDPSTGNALENTQRQGYQYGVNISASSGIVVVHGQLEPTSTQPDEPGESHGFFIGDGFQDNYLKVVMSDQQVLQVAGEENGVSIPNLPSVIIPDVSQELNVYFVIDPAKGSLQVQYALEDQVPASVGNPIVLPETIQGLIQSPDSPLIVGLIANSDDENYTAIFDFLNVYNQPEENWEVLYRVNAGGPALAAVDEAIDWEADEGQYVLSGGEQFSAIASKIENVPAGVPMGVFQTERWDGKGGNSPDEMEWAFPVEPGSQVQVRIYLSELYAVINDSTQRIFDVEVEGIIPEVFDEINQFALTGGLYRAGVLTHTLLVEDDTLNLKFLRIKQNPTIKGIEILGIPQENPAELVELYLVNTNTNEDIRPLKADDQINLADYAGAGLNIRAEVSSGTKSVAFTGEGFPNLPIKESSAPFALGGDKKGNFNDIKDQWQAGQTLYLNATPYTKSQAKGRSGLAKTTLIQIVDQYDLAFNVVGEGQVTFLQGQVGTNISGTTIEVAAQAASGLVFEGFVVNGVEINQNPYAFEINENTTLEAVFVPMPAVSPIHFWLVDATKKIRQGEDLVELQDQGSYDLSQFDTDAFTIRVTLDDIEPDSLLITLNGAVSQTNMEKLFPYTLNGDLPGQAYIPFDFLTGAYTLQCTVYREASSLSREIQFNLALSGSAARMLPADGSVGAEPEVKPEFIVYPNPIQNAGFSLQFQHLEAQPVHYQLRDVSGKVIAEGHLEAKSGEQKIHIDLRGKALTAGTFYLILSDQAGNILEKVKRVVKE